MSGPMMKCMRCGTLGALMCHKCKQKAKAERTALDLPSTTAGVIEKNESESVVAGVAIDEFKRPIFVVALEQAGFRIIDEMAIFQGKSEILMRVEIARGRLDEFKQLVARCEKTAKQRKR